MTGDKRCHLSHQRPGTSAAHATPAQFNCSCPSPTCARRKPNRSAACRRTHGGRRDPPDRLPTDSGFRTLAALSPVPVVRGQPGTTRANQPRNASNQPQTGQLKYSYRPSPNSTQPPTPGLAKATQKSTKNPTKSHPIRTQKHLTHQEKTSPKKPPKNLTVTKKSSQPNSKHNHRAKSPKNQSHVWHRGAPP